MIVVIAKLKFELGHADAAAQVLTSLVAQTRAEAGCLEYLVAESCASPGEFVLTERWRSEEDLRRHFQTEHMEELRPLLRELNLLEMVGDAYAAEDEPRRLPL